MNNSTISKLNKRSSQLRIIGLLLIFLSFITSLIFTTHQGTKIQQQKTIITKNDSILTKINDSTSKENSLISIATIYFNLRQEHKADSLENLYSDTVVNYFKNLKNIPKTVITKSDKLYWRHYPDDKFIITEPIKIILDSTGNKAIVKGKQCRSETKCVEVIVELHFNENKKINYVRAFYSK